MTTTTKHILKTNKYPTFIKNHPIFKTTKKVQKIYPLIGLPNCEEKVLIDNSVEAARFADLVHSDICVQCMYRPSYPIVRAFGDVCNATIDKFIVNSGGKLTLNLPADVVVDGKVIFKKGEGLFRAYNKLAKTHTMLPSLDAFGSFKAFSNANIPANEHKMVFSSDGVDGVWDIATMSMRGISSCQSWNSSNAKHLVGSMLDPFTGILYITSGSKIGDIGTKMFRRSLVRLVVNERTKKESLLIERMYPSYDSNVAKTFKEFLVRKTDGKYSVIDTSDMVLNTETHYSPCSSTIRSLPVDHRPYCDSKIEYKTDKHDAHGLRIEQIQEFFKRMPNMLALKVLANIKLLSKKNLTAPQLKTLAAFYVSIPHYVYNHLHYSIKSYMGKIKKLDDIRPDKLEAKLLKWVKASITYSLKQVSLSAGKANLLPDSVLSGVCKASIEQLSSEITSSFSIKKQLKKTKTSDKLYLSLLSY